MSRARRDLNLVRFNWERLLPLSALFRDVHDLVLEDEQIGRALTRQSHHVLIVVLDPSLDDLAVHQFDRDWILPFAKSLQKTCFFECIFRRRRPAAFGGIGIPLWSAKRHANIVHKARTQRSSRSGCDLTFGVQFSGISLSHQEEHSEENWFVTSYRTRTFCQHGDPANPKSLSYAARINGFQGPGQGNSDHSGATG